MRGIVTAGTSLLMLVGCGHSEQAVGANSPDSIVTTAVGNVVGSIPNETAAPDNAVTVAPDDDTMTAPNGAMTNDTMVVNLM